MFPRKCGFDSRRRYFSCDVSKAFWDSLFLTLALRAVEGGAIRNDHTLDGGITISAWFIFSPVYIELLLEIARITFFIHKVFECGATLFDRFRENCADMFSERS